MPNILKVTVENPDEILNPGAYDVSALIRLQTSATQAGTFADVTGTGATPTINVVATTLTYTGYDPAGTSSSWYRTRFENLAGTRLSDWATAFQVAPEGSGLIASIYDLKQKLGIVYTDISQDENLLEWLRQATDYIHGRVGRIFTPDPTTVYLLDGYAARRNHHVLYVPNGIRTLTLLEIALTTNGTFVSIPLSDIFLGPNPPEYGWPYTQIVMTDLPSAGNSIPFFPPGWRNVRPTGTFGFAAPPPALSAIGLTLAEAAARERGSGGGDSVTIGIGGERTFERALSWKDRDTLERYRNWAAQIK